MNDVTPTENEAPITFGITLMSFMVWLYNLRVTYPNEDIVLAFMDISACFRWPRLNPDMVGAFGFLIGTVYFAANAMTFGSVASASSWEPFRRAIEAMATAYFANSTLREVHREFLDVITWDDEAGADEPVVAAVPCSINKGINDENGNPKPTPHFIYVDDDLIADTKARMPQAIAAGIEAIFTVLGWPMLFLRQIAVSLKKLMALRVGFELILLGFVFNTRSLTIGIPDEFREETIALIEELLSSHDGCFTVRQIERVVGKLGRIGQAFRPIYHLMPHLYASTAYALKENKSYLVSTSARFRAILKKIKGRENVGTAAGTKDDLEAINFAIGEASRAEHRCTRRHKMVPTLVNELRAILRMLKDGTIKLRTPIALIIPRDHHFEVANDSSKLGGGGWSTHLSFVWDITYKAEVVRRAKLPNNKHGDYICINVLEFFCIIISLAASICALALGVPCDDPFPILLNFCDNKAACQWVNYRCKVSLIGRRLAMIYVGLLLNLQIGVQTEWLETARNFIADDISRINQRSPNEPFDYSTLVQKYPEQLKGCRRFVPSERLISLLYDVLLNNVSPDPLMLRKWRPEDLGSFSSIVS